MELKNNIKNHNSLVLTIEYYESKRLNSDDLNSDIKDHINNFLLMSDNDNKIIKAIYLYKESNNEESNINLSLLNILTQSSPEYENNQIYLVSPKHISITLNEYYNEYKNIIDDIKKERKREEKSPY